MEIYTWRAGIVAAMTTINLLRWKGALRKSTAVQIVLHHRRGRDEGSNRLAVKSRSDAHHNRRVGNDAIQGFRDIRG